MYISQDTANRIKVMAKQRKVSTTEMLRDCGLNKNTLATMTSRGSWLQANSLAIIADYLDCSVDYLLGRTETQKITAEPDEKAQQLLNAFYELNEDGRVKLLEEAIMMNASGFYRNNENIQIAARTGHTISTVVDNIDDYPDAPDNI